MSLKVSPDLFRDVLRCTWVIVCLILTGPKFENKSWRQVSNQVYTSKVTGNVSLTVWHPEFTQVDFTSSKLVTSLMVSRSGTFMLKVYSLLYFRNCTQSLSHIRKTGVCCFTCLNTITGFSGIWFWKLFRHVMMMCNI